MAYKTEEIKALFESAFNFKEVKVEDIPNIDLYVDQIIKIFEDRLSENNSEEKFLTKSMVNNYSKDKLISPVKGKKYTKEQILQILLIYDLKGILSIQNIKSVTNSIIDQENSQDSIEGIFKSYEDNYIYTQGLCNLICDKITSKYDNNLSVEELTSILLSISQVANCLRKAAELITQNYFED